ncbi:MAG: HAMP domain-containing sensor histidine kinase [Spirochaetaceae bacterium]|jgi:signal transduction histidine kinase|nr:HAMP domain-containing sensor histidine kinase [Spirochaetaceae bacterium]
MNEKRLLYLILTLIFLLLSTMSILLNQSQLQQQMMSYLLETEKLLNRTYQMYQADEIGSFEVPDNIEGMGFYNFYGEPMYLYGTALKELPEEIINTPIFDKKRDTIALSRDLLNPFIPVFGSKELINDAQKAMYSRSDQQPEEVKRKMVRYVYLEILDSPITGLILQYRIQMGIFILLILLIVIFMGSLYRRNMKYHNQIESQERLVLLGTAARTFTHEVKNPLSSIRLQSSIIKRSTAGEHTKALGIINEEVNRLTAMTERIGDFLRHPEGNPCRTDIASVVNRIIEKTHDKLGHIKLKNTPDLIIKIDPERLNSIMDNLLNNALESGSEIPDISVFLERHGAEAEIIVSDKGRGISEEDLKRVYDPFFTTKSKGSGVGLSIVHSFIHSAGGEMKISSSLNEGTTIKIRFPLVKDL